MKGNIESSLIQSVANAVRHFRTESGISQETLAEIAGLDRTYVSGVERGVRNITLQSLELIISALGVTTETFLEKVVQKSRNAEGENA